MMRILSRKLFLLLVRLLGAWGAFAATRKSRQHITHNPRILLIHPGPLGALILTTPVFQALKTRLPDARLTLMVGPWSKEVVANHLAIDQLLVYRFPSYRSVSPKGFRSYVAMIRLARQLDRSQFDLAINLHRNFWWGAAVIYLARIPRRIGYAVSSSPPFLTDALPFQPHQHMTISYLIAASAGLQALGYEAISKPYTPERYPLYVAPTADDQRWVARQLDAQGIDAATPLVCIHPGTSVAVKQWRPEAWGACATELGRGWTEQSAVHFLLTGSQQERPLLETIACVTSMHTTILTSMTVGQLAALLGRCRLVLGVDNGPLHLAVAQGTPTLKIFGPTDPHRYGAWGSPQRHAVVTASHPCPGCLTIPCGRLHFQPREFDSHLCVRLIEEQQVISAIFELLSSLEKAPAGSLLCQREER
jgi:ADP-heptose:LPS heptosyltransferase